MARPKSFLGVMVSSTFTDLKKHREAVISLVQSHGLLPIDMEHQGGARADLDVLESSLQMVRDSAAYIGIIGQRYGLIPSARNPARLSITELELDEALRLKRPILLFLMAADHPLTISDIELDASMRKKLAAFRERARRWQQVGGIERVYEEFSSLEQLRVAAAIAIPRLKAFLEAQAAPRRTLVGRAAGAGGTGSRYEAGPTARRAGFRPAAPPRLELLCDRARVDNGFTQALEQRPDRRRPGCLILFGESDQGQAEYLARMKAYTLPLRHGRYPQGEVIKVDLDDYRGDEVSEVAAQIFDAGAVALKHVPATTAAGLYQVVRKRKLDLCLIYATVKVLTQQQARDWIACFEAIQGMFELDTDGPQVVLALSIEYPRGFWLLRRARDLTRLFKKEYPEEFPETRRRSSAAAPPGLAPRITVRRLSPVREEHVKGWCDHRQVQAYIQDIDAAKEDLLMLFNKPGKELPMQTVLQKLKDLIHQHSRRGPAR